MALGATVPAAVLHNEFQKTLPFSLTSGWQSLIDAGGLIVQDAAIITNAATQITNSTRHVFNRVGQGTVLLTTMKYDAGLTISTAPVIKVFGRTGSDIWLPVRMRNSSQISASLVNSSTTDGTDGTFKYTTPDYNLQAWDCIGYEEILVGVETILAGTGTVNNAALLGRFV